MRLLKAVVIGTAVLILVGVAVLIWGVTHHWNDRGSKPGATVATANPPVASNAGPSPGQLSQETITTEIAAPDGMHLEQTLATADRLMLRFVGSQGDRILIVDPRSGRVTGSIFIAPSAK